MAELTGDIAHIWDPDRIRGDWTAGTVGLAQDPGLATSVILSLFTDREAEAADILPDGTRNRRGWWGDRAFLDDGAQPWLRGSRLWLLSREKWTQDTANRAVNYAREALAWMLEDGVADAVDVVAEMSAVGRINLIVTITKDGRTVGAGRYGLTWAALAAA